MEYIKRAASVPKGQDSEIRAAAERMLADIRLAHDQGRCFTEAQRGGLRKYFPDEGWDFDVYDQKRYD